MVEAAAVVAPPPSSFSPEEYHAEPCPQPDQYHLLFHSAHSASLHSLFSPLPSAAGAAPLISCSTMSSCSSTSPLLVPGFGMFPGLRVPTVETKANLTARPRRNHFHHACEGSKGSNHRQLEANISRIKRWNNRTLVFPPSLAEVPCHERGIKWRRLESLTF